MIFKIENIAHNGQIKLGYTKEVLMLLLTPISPYILCMNPDLIVGADRLGQE